jgi:hypothetical protein
MNEYVRKSRVITFFLSVAVDGHLADGMLGDPGWSSQDDCEEPQSGLEILTDHVQNHLCQLIEQQMKCIDAEVVRSTSVTSDAY